jgi:hypothetical protein
VGLRKVLKGGVTESGIPVEPATRIGASGQNRSAENGSESDNLIDTSGGKVARRIDHALAAAVKRGILSVAQIDGLGQQHSGSDAAFTWRQFVLAFPLLGEPLYELAAEIYGFRSATVCQIGTLIYNHKLTEFFSATDWNRLFERGVVPVIEYGKYPQVVRHHLLASSDPGSRHIRSLQHELPLSHTELVFVPKAGIHKLQYLLATNIPAMTINPFIMHRMSPPTRLIPQQDTLQKRAA